MGLDVVGAGFGRTGTLSLKLALEQLGFGPCHHMYEVAERPEQLPYWQAAARGEIPDWDLVFKNFRSCVDWPSARFWREISSHYSKASVILSVRSPESWFKSVHATIYPAMQNRHAREPGFRRNLGEMAYELIVAQTFDNRMDDFDHAVAVFNAHLAEVRRTIAADRLLVFNVTEGWAPLCRFLGVPTPETPFPRANSTEEFQQQMSEPADGDR